MSDKFIAREQYKTLEKVADEMLAVLKSVQSGLQQLQTTQAQIGANQSNLISQLSQYISKIETEKNKPDKSELDKSDAPSPDGVDEKLKEEAEAAKPT